MTHIAPIIAARLPPLNYRVADYIPVVSTITSLGVLALKALSSCYTSPPSYSHTWLNGVSHYNSLRSCLLLVPILGNIVVYFWDRQELKRLTPQARQELGEISQPSYSTLDKLYHWFHFTKHLAISYSCYGQQMSSSGTEKNTHLLMQDLCQLLQKEPQNPTVLGALSLLASQLSHEHRADLLPLLQTAGISSWIELASKAMALNPKEVSVYLAAVDIVDNLIDTETPQTLLPEKHRETILSYYTRAIQENPSSPVYWGDLGCALKKEAATVQIDGKSIDAKACYIKAVELGPQTALYWRWLGDALASIPEPEIAVVLGKRITREACYIKAIGLVPDDLESWESLGETLSSLTTVAYPVQVHIKPIHHAYECYIQAVELDPDAAYSWQKLGECLRPLKDIPYPLTVAGTQVHSVYECYAKALQLCPQDAYFWENLGTEIFISFRKSLPCYPLLVHGEQINNLEEFCKKALELHPNSCTLWHLLAIVLTPLSQSMVIHGERINSAQAYAKAIELDPTAPEYWWSLGYLLMGSPQCVFVDGQRIDNARVCFEKAASLTSDRPSFQKHLLNISPPSIWNRLSRALRG